MRNRGLYGDHRNGEKAWEAAGKHGIDEEDIFDEYYKTVSLQKNDDDTNTVEETYGIAVGQTR